MINFGSQRLQQLSDGALDHVNASHVKPATQLGGSSNNCQVPPSLFFYRAEPLYFRDFEPVQTERVPLTLIRCAFPLSRPERWLGQQASPLQAPPKEHILWKEPCRFTPRRNPSVRVPPRRQLCPGPLLERSHARGVHTRALSMWGGVSESGK